MSSPAASTISRLLRGHRPAVAAMAATSLLGGLAEAAFLVVITRAAFAITNGRTSIGTLAGYHFSVGATVLLALGLVLFRVVMAVIANWLSAGLTAEVTRSLRGRLAHAFLRSSWPTQDTARAGHLQELVTSYANTGAQLLGSLTNGIVAGFSLLALLALATGVDPIGSLIAIAALGLLGSVLRPLRRRVQQRARRATDDGLALALATNEIADLGMVVQVFDVRPQVEARIDALLDDGVRSSRRLGLVRGLVPAIYAGLAYLALVGAVALASVWDTASLTSLGAVMMVMLRSLAYGQNLQVAYSGVASNLPQVHDVFTEIERYEANAVVDGGEPVAAVLPLVLHDVAFEYVDGQRVLNGVSAEIRPGEMIGVVGPSGSGKSTLVQLILGLRPPTSGRITAAGCDIAALRRSDWARRVTFVPQAAALVRGSIADNIRFFRDGVDDAAVERAARLAGLHDEVIAFPDGYAHQVGDRGGNLSGGQQQRVCIARALVGDPHLLVLDEPTSALDARSETLVRDTLHRLRAQMTVVVIAHRLSTLDECDRIMVVQHGTIAAFDTPAALRAQANFYAEALQLSGLT